MSDDVVLIQKPSALDLERVRAAAALYMKGARAPSTWRAYRSDWDTFVAWCQKTLEQPLPSDPATIARFITAQAEMGIAPATLSRRLSAIRLIYLSARLLPPTDAFVVHNVMRKIRRARKLPIPRKAPAVDRDIIRMVDAIDLGTREGLRDRAILLLGFAGALRSSELVALDTAHIIAGPIGVHVTFPPTSFAKSMADKVVLVRADPASPYCPVRAVSEWLVAANIKSGAIFRRMRRGDTVAESRLTSQSVARIVKYRAANVALDASRYAAHSLRSGFLATAARNGASISAMAAHSRYQNFDRLRQYVRDEGWLEPHPCVAMLRADPVQKPPAREEGPTFSSEAEIPK